MIESMLWLIFVLILASASLFAFFSYVAIDALHSINVSICKLGVILAELSDQNREFLDSGCGDPNCPECGAIYEPVDEFEDDPNSPFDDLPDLPGDEWKHR